MSLDKIRSILLNNPGAKIVSLFFAIFLWLHVTAQQGENQSFRVPLTLAGIPDSLTIIHKVPEFIEVTIRGPRSNLLKLRLFGKPKAVVDLSMAKKGRVNIPLSSAILNLSDDFDQRYVTIDNPKTLVLNFEQLVTKSVPVRIAYKGDIGEEIIIAGSPVVIPARVKVRGAASIVQPINFLTTRELDIKNRRGEVTIETGLETEGLDIAVIPDKILIEMEIYKREIRTIPNIPPTLLQDDESLIVEYSPRVVSLTIEGPEQVIRNIVADDISVILNITTRKPGIYRIEPEVIVPQGVEKYFLDTDVFEIRISPGNGAAAREKGSPPNGSAGDE